MRLPLFIAPLLTVLLALLTGCSPGWEEQARELETAGDWAGANRIYEERLLEHPDDLEATRGLAVNLMLLQRHDEALPYQEKVVELDDEDSQTRVELAFNYLNHQDSPAEAASVMAEAAQIDPSARNRTFLAQTLAANERWEEALEELGDVRKAYPEYQYAVTLLEQYRSQLDGGAEPADTGHSPRTQTTTG